MSKNQQKRIFKEQPCDIDHLCLYLQATYLKPNTES